MQLMVQLLDIITECDTEKVADLQKAKIAEVIAETEFKLLKGGSEELNMLYMFMNINKIMHL